MKYAIALCLMFAAISSALAAEMSHEETVVRTAYAKFAYAAQQQVIGEFGREAATKLASRQYAQMTHEERFAAAKIDFTLADFVVGDARDILKRKVTDFITLGDTEIIAISERTSDFNDNGLQTSLYGLVPRWTKAHPVPPILESLTLDDSYALEWRQPRPDGLWQRYASYTVTVTFQGKTIGPYKALFFFGHNAKGDEAIEPRDSITDNVGLGEVLAQHLFPDAFVLTKLRTYPVVANWLAANQASGPNCSAGKGDVCCDLVKLQCGPGREDMAVGLARPLPGETKSQNK
jgi:hypothetical protein